MTPTIRNKIFNYKETVESINTDDLDTFGTNLPSCQCQDSPFVDPDHGHIMTGDLSFVKNKHLRKLISKGPNYREPRNINWNKCREVISGGLDAFVDKTSNRINVDNSDFSLWKSEVLK